MLMGHLGLRGTQRQQGSHRPEKPASWAAGWGLFSTLCFQTPSFVLQYCGLFTLGTSYPFNVQAAQGFVQGKVDISFYVAGSAVNWPHSPWSM